MVTSMSNSAPYRSVLITGAGGYIGRIVVEKLAKDRLGIETIIATDIREFSEEEKNEGVLYYKTDVRAEEIAEIMTDNRVDAVVHLAAIVSPGKKPDRELEYSVDVLGTKNILECCVKAGVKKIINTSSGAAYGYYADNPEWLDENDRIRGNSEFSYSDHKRQVEEMLAGYRENHPELEQLIFRPGTILGRKTSNQITDLFDGKRLIGLKGVSIPFVFIWDEDVAGAILKGLHERGKGIYNMAGDGALTMKEMAQMMNKPYISLPIGLVSWALRILKKLGLTQYGPEQVNFLRYRPVLSNRRLKEEFGYIPQKTTREVFEYFIEARGSS